MKITFDYVPSPAEMAEEYSEWSSEEQASFLSSVARIFMTWSGTHGSQSQALQISRRLTPQAIELLEGIIYFAKDKS